MKDTKSKDRTPAKPDSPASSTEPQSREIKIVSPRDEGGVPYPGDMPPSLGDLYRGCF
jgi:hypothetical protein